MKFLYVLSLLAVYLHHGEAIKCYQCDSRDPKCIDPVGNKMEATECSATTWGKGLGMARDAVDSVTSLFKSGGFDTGVKVPDADAIFSCAKVVRTDGDTQFIVRQCSVRNNKLFDVCKEQEETQGALVASCHTCDSDECNSASGLAPVMVLTALTSLAALFLARY